MNPLVPESPSAEGLMPADMQVMTSSMLRMPSPLRRLGTLTVFFAAASTLASLLPMGSLWDGTLLAMIGLAFLAGFSALWSP